MTDEQAALTQDDRIALISALAEIRERGILPVYRAVERIVAEHVHAATESLGCDECETGEGGNCRAHRMSTRPAGGDADA